MAGQGGEEKPDILGRPGHRAADSQQAARVGDGREMTGGGHAAGVGFKPAIPQKWAGTRIEAAAVTPDSARPNSMKRWLPIRRRSIHRRSAPGSMDYWCDP